MWRTKRAADMTPPEKHQVTTITSAIVPFTAGQWHS
jgi:hypothetical protein